MVFVKVEGVVIKDGDLVWLRPYKQNVMFACTPATYIASDRMRGKWLLYITIAGTSVTEIQVYLFKRMEEYRLWEKLKGLPRLGPRRAAAVIATYPPDEFFRILALGDKEALRSIKGIGSKTAASIIAHFSDALEDISEDVKELHKIFTDWGFEKSEVNRAISLLMRQDGFENMSLENKVRAILKVMSDE